jgi:hypothetical protein
MKAKVLFLFLLATACGVTAANWPGFRYDGLGISTEKSAPIRWSATENVRWRVALPDAGNSSPIVWDNRVFITQAQGEKRSVICFDRTNGKQLWQQGVSYAEKDDTHETNPHASPTPVTDGTRVIAWFGSAGVVCYDCRKELWRRDWEASINGATAVRRFSSGLVPAPFGPARA